MLTSVKNVCVVTTFYTLDGMKSILLPKFVFSSFKATPFSQKYKFIILLFYLNFYGCCTSYYNIPPSLPEGGCKEPSFYERYAAPFRRTTTNLAYREPRRPYGANIKAIPFLKVFAGF